MWKIGLCCSLLVSSLAIAIFSLTELIAVKSELRERSNEAIFLGVETSMFSRHTIELSKAVQNESKLEVEQLVYAQLKMMKIVLERREDRKDEELLREVYHQLDSWQPEWLNGIEDESSPRRIILQR